MNVIKQYLKAGKPLVGIRTANHAFSVRDGVADVLKYQNGIVMASL